MPSMQSFLDDLADEMTVGPSGRQRGFALDVPRVWKQKPPKLYPAKARREVAQQLSHSLFRPGIDVPDSDELILGWRVWREGSWGKKGGKQLRSLAQDTQWVDRDIEAHCLRYANRGPEFVDLSPEELCTYHIGQCRVGTGRPCTCGLYTVKSIGDVPKASLVGDVPKASLVGDDYYVLGAVSVYGTVAETRLGYLSDKARIEGLFMVAAPVRCSRQCCAGLVELTPKMEADARGYAKQFNVPVKMVTAFDLQGLGIPVRSNR